MIPTLKPYPAMKDSGVPWLGEVPEHWKVQRLGTLLKERQETNADLSVTSVLSVVRNRGVIRYDEKGNVGNKKSDDISRYKVVQPGDIVVNSMNVIIGSVGLSQYRGCLSPVYYVLLPRTHDDDVRYLSCYFETIPFQQSLVRIGNGILAHRMRIPMELRTISAERQPAQRRKSVTRAGGLRRALWAGGRTSQADAGGRGSRVRDPVGKRAARGSPQSTVRCTYPSPPPDVRREPPSRGRNRQIKGDQGFDAPQCAAPPRG